MMKILKSLLLTLLLLAATEYANGQSWTTVNSTRGNFSFQLPNNNYTSKDSLNVLFYNYQVDTVLTIVTHYIDNAYMVQNDSLFTVLLNQNYGDSLRAVGGLMLLLTNGQLQSIQDINPTSYNPKGIEIGFNYVADQTGDGLLFSRIFYKNGKFTAFTISSIGSDSVRLGVYKTTFFNSIDFSQP